nr:ABC transporter substrate-binding protein [uncultured Cohaesibacter sp.]
MLETTRRRFLLGTAFVAASTTLSLSMPAFAAAPVKGGTLRVAIDQAVSVLNPLLVRVNPEYMLSELLYSGLTRLKVDMSPEADLAESWSANEELTEWTFTLRKGVKFHDGSALTAADVVASYKAILNPDTASPGRKNIGPIEDVVAKDDLTVVFKLTGPYADMPVATAYMTAKIVPATIIESGLDKLSSQAVGTGPFKLVSFEPDRQVVVERNPDYYDPERPYLDKVVLNVYPDATAGSSALIAGEIDLISTLDPTEYMRLDGNDGIDVQRVASGQFCNVNMRCDEKPFDDPRVRQALALSVDRDAMIQFVTEGFGTAGNDTPINNAYRFYSELPMRKPDIEKAKQLLADAGYADGIKITLVASEKPALRTQLAVALREMAKPAGFDIDVQTMPHATYLDQVWKKGNFYVGFYNMQPTEDGIFKLLYTSDAAWNETRWNNTDFDKAVNSARITTDDATRAELYAEAQKLQYEGVPSIIPTFFDVLGAKRTWVAAYDIHPRASVFRFDHAWLTDKAPTRS